MNEFFRRKNWAGYSNSSLVRLRIWIAKIPIRALVSWLFPLVGCENATRSANKSLYYTCNGFVMEKLIMFYSSRKEITFAHIKFSVNLMR